MLILEIRSTLFSVICWILLVFSVNDCNLSFKNLIFKYLRCLEEKEVEEKQRLKLYS